MRLKKTPRSFWPVCLGALVLAALVAGCGGGIRQDPILRLSAQEALEQGKALLEAEKYVKAQPLLIHAFEVEPNSRNGREALLLASDALYLGGSTENYIKCEAKYRDFLNRFPTSERSDYAQFQVANCLAKRVEKPDRDQKVTRQATAAYEELMRLYPTSPYAAEARAKIDEVLHSMAAHEYVVGNYYLRVLNCQASINRFEYLMENYPSYTEMDRVYVELGLAQELCGKSEEAAETFADLQQRFPESLLLMGLDKKRSKYAGKAEQFQNRNKKRMEKARRGRG